MKLRTLRSPVNLGVFALVIAATLICGSPGEGAEKKAEVVYTSPSGALRIEISGEGAAESAWVVSAKDPTQRAKLPKESDDSTLDDEFHCSPDGEWIFGLRHAGSGLRDGYLYHRVNPLKVEMVDKKKSFNEWAWKEGVKLGALKRNFSGEGLYAMTFFGSWSLDSSRLLLELRGGEEKRSMQTGYLYFNMRTKTFEMTPYLRSLKKAGSAALACAEPADPLPTEEDLKARLDLLDGKLNKSYAERLSKTAKDRVSILRDSQREWIKNRDEGLRLYLASAVPAEKERRRLQFLGDVTAARLDDFNRPLDEDL